MTTLTRYCRAKTSYSTCYIKMCVCVCVSGVGPAPWRAGGGGGVCGVCLPQHPAAGPAQLAGGQGVR